MKALTPGSYWTSNQKLYCITFDNTGKRYLNIKSYKTHIISPKTVVIICGYIENTAWDLFNGKESINMYGEKYRSNIIIPEISRVSPDTLLRQYKILFNDLVVFRHEFVDNDVLGNILISTDKFTRFTGKKKQKNLGTLYPGNKK